MKAIVYDRHGGPEVLQYRDVPIPEVSPVDVLIRVKATALNYNDIWGREGVPGIEFPFPHISGSDASGIIEEVGSAVRNVQPGDEVVVSPCVSCGYCRHCIGGEPMFCSQFKEWGFQTGPLDGAEAEYVKISARNVVAKPKDLPFEEAASMPLVLGTAWRMLVTRAKIKPGDFVLIWGGAGGLGCMAVQICNLFHARAIGVVGSDEKAEALEELGAPYIINRKTENVLREIRKITKRKGVDIVFEHVGETTWQTSINALRWAGTLVVCGATTGFKAVTDLRFLWNKQQNYLGSHSATTAEVLEAIRFVETGQIRPVIKEVMPLKDIVRGLNMLESGDVIGKVVLVP